MEMHELQSLTFRASESQFMLTARAKLWVVIAREDEPLKIGEVNNLGAAPR